MNNCGNLSLPEGIYAKKGNDYSRDIAHFAGSEIGKEVANCIREN